MEFPRHRIPHLSSRPVFRPGQVAAGAPPAAAGSGRGPIRRHRNVWYNFVLRICTYHDFWGGLAGIAVAKKEKHANPFYVLLIVVGVAFAVTACAYGVMTVRGMNPRSDSETSPAGAALMDFLDQHGLAVLMAELGLLGVSTVGAIGTDQYWSRRSGAAEQPLDSSQTARADTPAADSKQVKRS